MKKVLFLFLCLGWGWIAAYSQSQIDKILPPVDRRDEKRKIDALDKALRNAIDNNAKKQREEAAVAHMLKTTGMAQDRAMSQAYYNQGEGNMIMNEIADKDRAQHKKNTYDASFKYNRPVNREPSKPRGYVSRKDMLSAFDSLPDFPSGGNYIDDFIRWKNEHSHPFDKKEGQLLLVPYSASDKTGETAITEDSQYLSMKRPSVRPASGQRAIPITQSQAESGSYYQSYQSYYNNYYTKPQMPTYFVRMSDYSDETLLNKFDNAIDIFEQKMSELNENGQHYLISTAGQKLAGFAKKTISATSSMGSAITKTYDTVNRILRIKNMEVDMIEDHLDAVRLSIITGEEIHVNESSERAHEKLMNERYSLMSDKGLLTPKPEDAAKPLVKDVNNKLFETCIDSWLK